MTDAKQSPKFHPPDLLPPSPTAAPELSVAYDGLSFWQYMVAGSIAGVVEHSAVFPVDTIKTRMQAHAPPCRAHLGLGHAVRSAFRTEGPLSLYRGVGAMVLGAGPAHAAYFSVYEVAKRFLSQGKPGNWVVHGSAGVLATLAQDAVMTPVDTVKQRLQLRDSPYKGAVDCVTRVLREEGVRALYASYRTTVLMNAPYTAIYFATYEATKHGLSEIHPENASEERLIVHATAGAAAGALAATFTTPLDVVKTQLQCQGVCGCDRFSSSSIGEVIQAIIKRDGYAGLMRGWMPRMLFHAPAAAICWSVYEAAKSFFREHNDQVNVS